MKRVTVKDIAYELNIAQSTVSKALSDKTGVSAEMKKNIHAASERLGYKANRLAQGLARKPIVIGIIMPNIWPEFYVPLEKGIKNQLKALSDYKIVARFKSIPSLHCEMELETAIDEFIEEQVSAVILCPVYNTSCGKYLEKLHKHNIELVLLGTDLANCERLKCIRVDAYKAGKLAGEFIELILHNSKKVTVFIGNRDMQEHNEKCQGIADALAHSDCTIVGIYETQDVPEIAYYITKKVLQEVPALESIYVATGNSIAVCKALIDLGMEKQVKVVATDIFPEIKEYMDANIIKSVIFQNPEQQGKIAVQCLYEHFVENKISVKEVLVHPILVMRANINDYL